MRLDLVLVRGFVRAPVLVHVPVPVFVPVQALRWQLHEGPFRRRRIFPSFHGSSSKAPHCRKSWGRCPGAWSILEACADPSIETPVRSALAGTHASPAPYVYCMSSRPSNTELSCGCPSPGPSLFVVVVIARESLDNVPTLGPCLREE